MIRDITWLLPLSPASIKDAGLFRWSVSMEILTSGVEAALAKLEQIKKQTAYATAVALTRTAQDIQQDVLERTPNLFSIRGSWFKKGGRFGVRLDPARKDSLQARIYNEAPWMVGHETGEQRKPKGQHRAIPLDNVKRTKRDIIRAGQRPRALKNAFVQTLKSGTPLLFQHVGKKGLRAMYVLIKKAEIKPTWHFVDSGKAIFQSNFERRFDAEFARSMASAR